MVQSAALDEMFHYGPASVQRYHKALILMEGLSRILTEKMILTAWRNVSSALSGACQHYTPSKVLVCKYDLGLKKRLENSLLIVNSLCYIKQCTMEVDHRIFNDNFRDQNPTVDLRLRKPTTAAAALAATQQQATANHPQSPVTTFTSAASPSAPQSPNYQIIMSRSPVTGQNMNITLQNVGQMVTGNQQITLTPVPLQNPASPGFQHTTPQWRFEPAPSSYIQIAPATAAQVQLTTAATPGSVRERRLSQPHSQTGGTIHHLGPQSPVATGSALPTLGSPGHITTSNLPPQISNIIQGQLARPMIFEKTPQGVVAGTTVTPSFNIPTSIPPSSPSLSNPPQSIPNNPLGPSSMTGVQ
ncbi:hypothetical protein WMY93_004784 [Mugilogobius chulae]|uniref:E1A-binding protein p400 N-terminal domain-containing protein n=1 Tax=Mugilogobius chulae TaxID=88201 RepID=A0AAW0PT55_9GOBI